MKNKLFILISLIFTSLFPFNINAAPMKKNSILHILIKCDGSFFKTIYENKYPSLKIIKQRSNKVGNNGVLKLIKLLNIKNLSISGYYEISSWMKNNGEYFYWGFILDNTLQDIMENMPGIKWQRVDENLVYNPMYKLAGDKQWKKNSNLTSDIAQGRKIVEKLVVLSAYGYKSKLLCSLQGDITKEDLNEIRPDLITIEQLT